MICTRTTLSRLLVLVGLACAPSAASAAQKVAVVSTVQATEAVTSEVHRVIAELFDAFAIDLVADALLTPEDMACSDVSCFAAFAKRVGATHVLLVQGAASPAGYRLSLDMRDGDSGRSLANDNKDCELCAERDFAPTVQERVSKLWMRVIQEQEAAQTPAGPQTGLAPVEEPEEIPGPDATPAPSFWSQRTPVLGLGFLGAGVIVAAFGIYYIAVDGNSVDTNPQGSAVIVRDTGKWGWSLALVGAASAAAGASMVIWGRADGASVSVAAGPGSMWLHGRF